MENKVTRAILKYKKWNLKDKKVTHYIICKTKDDVTIFE